MPKNELGYLDEIGRVTGIQSRSEQIKFALRMLRFITKTEMGRLGLLLDELKQYLEQNANSTNEPVRKKERKSHAR